MMRNRYNRTAGHHSSGSGEAALKLILFLALSIGVQVLVSALNRRLSS
ncbi:MAG TPA: hypothetical protein VH599_08450 [Ktedonobacterales bacterium]|jgi:hypothetical protein